MRPGERMEEHLQGVADRGGDPWASMSMGGGRKLEPYGDCPKSPDGRHHYTAVSCVQSVEHFVCDHCGDGHWD